LSSQPPTNPEIEPYVSPMTRIVSVAAKPIAIEIRPPRATRVSRSRPNWSVPNGCARLVRREDRDEDAERDERDEDRAGDDRALVAHVAAPGVAPEARLADRHARSGDVDVARVGRIRRPHPLGLR
jgi:hypothetical protein